MTKVSRLELINIFNTTNLRPAYDFMKETGIFDFDSRELKIDPKEVKKQYTAWKKVKMKRRDLIMMLEGRKGRPKKVKVAVN
jgi:hypothetical protein